MKKIGREELLIIICYCVYCFLFVMQSTQFDNGEFSAFARLAKYIIFCCVLLIVFWKCHLSFNDAIKYFAFFGISSVIAIKCGRLSDIMLVASFICAGSRIKSGAIIRSYYYVILLCVFTILFGIFIGLYENEYIIDQIRGNRYFFGYSYTTILPNYCFHAVLAYVSVKKNNISLSESIIILSGNYLLYFYTQTRAIYYAVILLVICLWFLKVCPSLFQTRLFGFGCTCSFSVLAFTIIMISKYYSSTNSFLLSLNGKLSDRLRLGNKAIVDYGFSLFGKEIPWATGRLGIERFTDYFYVDSSYLNLLLSFGIIVFIYIIANFSLLTWKAYKHKNYNLCIALLFLALHSFTDPQLFELRYNPFLVLLGIITFHDKNNVLSLNNWL